MIPVLSRAQMRAFDAYAIETCHVPSLLLMENAGRGAADVIEREVCGGSVRAAPIVVVCGTGNNGGDGFVVARHLLARSAFVRVWLAGDPLRMTPDCRANHEAFVGLGGRVDVVGESPDALAAAIASADVVVDALFGTGLDREIGPPLSNVAALLRRGPGASARVVALDVPSGLNADTGTAMGTAASANLTVTFAHLKLGQLTGTGARLSGPVHVVDIGVPASLRADRSAELIEASDVRALVVKRNVDTHKYRAGHVAVVAGSPGKVGAALLAATGALRGGAGAATILTWPAAGDALEGRVAEVMVQRLTDVDRAEQDAGALRGSVDACLAGKRAVVVGPGFGTGALARVVVQHIVASFRGAIVADADALTLYAGSPEDFAIASGRLVLTPHAGELGRLLGRTADEVEADRFKAASDAAAKAQCVVLLKGAYTIVAAPDGRVVVTGSGGPALATAGSGDVLSGLVGALSCSLPPFEAAWCGAFLHGVSGSAWQKEHGDRGLLASEIADGLPGVLSALLAG